MSEKEPSFQEVYDSGIQSLEVINQKTMCLTREQGASTVEAHLTNVGKAIMKMRHDFLKLHQELLELEEKFNKAEEEAATLADELEKLTN